MTGIFGGIRKLKVEKKPSNSSKGKTTEVLARALKVLTNVTKETANDDKTIHALQDLYHITEKEPGKIRIELVYQAEAKLVPVLLDLLLNIHTPKSHAHNLTLVLLNNLSTETENQRFIALDCGGVKILSQLLCEDPSCHLVAICLVNLSFSSVAVRRDWVSLNKDIQWMQALTFCIRVASMTREEYHLVQPFLEESTHHRRTPAEFLAILQADKRTRSASSGSTWFQIHETLPSHEDQLFPETVRWCLCILKNLTRPHSDIKIADIVFRSGIVPFLLQCITLCHVKSRSPVSEENPAIDSYDVVESPSNISSSVALNSPDTWDSSSSEDAAMYVLMNLAANDKNHRRLLDMDSILLLSLVTQFAESHARGEEDAYVPDHIKIMEFQGLKARIAMAFMLGSKGHFGQPPQIREGADETEDKETLLTMTKSDAVQLLELLANTLHSREKPGAGGYSAFAMSPKMVLKAVRCLLVEYKNQVLFSEVTGTRLNALLLKAMALHIFGGRPQLDSEAAEYACVSLYLQSNHGFKHPFLPSVYGVGDPSKGTAARVLAAFARSKSTSVACRHASQQLIQRVPYLRFGSSDRDVALSAGNFELSDFLLPSDLLKVTKLINLPPDFGGTAPRCDLYDRPLFRRRTPRVGAISWGTETIEWFPSALIAIQDIIFESIMHHPEVSMDDIGVASVIAQCADGETADAYDYIWAWQDDSNRIRMFFGTNSFHPCSGQSLSSKLLGRAVGRLGWATCGNTSVQHTSVNMS